MTRRLAIVAGSAVGAFAAGAHADPVVGLTINNALVSFDSATPGTVSAPVAISGLQAGESILGIDFRPANGMLYGLGSTSRLYTINASTGAATAVGGQFTTLLSGSVFGFDFNPTVDRVRVTSNARQNMRLNPITGAIASVDGMLAFDALDPNAGKTPNVVGSAYTNNFAGATSTILYNIDGALDILVRQDPPNDGTLKTVGFLGIDTGVLVGFDIATSNGAAFAALDIAGFGQSTLYQIDLVTGNAIFRGGIVTDHLSDIAVAVPTPGSVALLGVAGLVGLRRRQR